MVAIDSIKKLEFKVENRIKTSYSKGDYMRCYNLLKLMHKINKKNQVMIRYANKLSENKIEKQKRRWVLGSSSLFFDIISSPKIYIAFFFLMILGRFK